MSEGMSRLDSWMTATVQSGVDDALVSSLVMCSCVVFTRSGSLVGCQGRVGAVFLVRKVGV